MAADRSASGLHGGVEQVSDERQAAAAASACFRERLHLAHRSEVLSLDCVQIAPLVTLLQEQICAVSGKLVAPPSTAALPDVPMINSCGLQGSAAPLLASAESTP